MSTLVETFRDARARGDHRAMVEAIPYARFLGMTTEIVDGELLCRLPFAPHIVGNPALPAIHGGVVGSLLESAAVFELLWAADTITLPKTVTLTVDYLRSAKPIELWAKGVITKHGRRVVNVRVEAWQEDRTRPVAMALAHFLVVPPEG